ncbi:type I pantothenate kinase [Maritalea sp.]|uniref:type I pantothenate kinase n=1 Tax=Maritalea sp. TaxID=2003361 RepID=UPI003EF4B22B
MDQLKAAGYPSPYRHFSKAEWAALRADELMTLTADDLVRLQSLNDPISLAEAEKIYLPLARLLSIYVEAVQGLHLASGKFLHQNGEKAPFIIGVAGSVSVGKSTTARILRALLQRWPSSPKVDLVTTDGFLLPNAQLEKRGLMEKKGFPESYDRGAFLKFLARIKAGEPNVSVPTYSHLVYDVVKGEEITVDRPSILIVEGLNILQPGELPKNGKPILFASDYLDFSIYIDAAEANLRKWYVERFLRLRETAFQDPTSFFHRFSKLDAGEAKALAISIWEQINLPNLTNNILPTRGRADLILKKGPDHTIDEVALRKL